MINILLLLAVVFWGLSFIGTKMALDYLTPSEIITVRLLFGFPVLFLIMKIRRLKFNLRNSNLPVLAIASMIIIIHFVIQAFGLKYTSATNTSWLIATIPIFIALASRLFLKEKITGLKIVGIVIATIGVLLLISRGELDNIGWLESVGDWIILSSCLSWTAYTILTRDIALTNNPLSAMTTILIIPAIGLTIFTLGTGSYDKIIDLPLNIVLILLGLGILCTALAQWFWLEGLARKGALRTGMFIYLEPIVTTLAAIPILGESLNIIGFFGAALILGGVYLVERQKFNSFGKK